MAAYSHRYQTSARWLAAAPQQPVSSYHPKAKSCAFHHCRGAFSWKTAGTSERLRMERTRTRGTRRETWIVPGLEIQGEIQRPETRGQSVWKKESGHQQPSSHPRPLSFGGLLPERCPFAEKCQAHHIPPATQRSSLGSAARSDKG